MPARSLLTDTLGTPAAYPHAVRRLKAIETPAAWVFLTGPYAYKLRKPLAGEYLDCSALAARRFACEEELRLNRRLAPELYLDVVQIRGSLQAPRIGGEGPTLDYALRMRQFPQHALATRMLARGRLTAHHIRELARYVAGFHASLRTPHRTCFGTPGATYRFALAVLDQMNWMCPRAADRERVDLLRAWVQREFELRCRELQLRWERGMVREGHGDLRLSKVVLLNRKAVPFGCADERVEARWKDVIAEVATLMIDLIDHRAPDFAQLFLDTYLEASDDMAGRSILPFYMTLEALDRARIHLAHAWSAEPASSEETRRVLAFSEQLALACRVCEPHDSALLLREHATKKQMPDGQARTSAPAPLHHMSYDAQHNGCNAGRANDA